MTNQENHSWNNATLDMLIGELREFAKTQPECDVYKQLENDIGDMFESMRKAGFTI